MLLDPGIGRSTRMPAFAAEGIDAGDELVLEVLVGSLEHDANRIIDIANARQSHSHVSSFPVKHVESYVNAGKLSAVSGDELIAAAITG